MKLMVIRTRNLEYCVKIIGKKKLAGLETQCQRRRHSYIVLYVTLIGHDHTSFVPQTYILLPCLNGN